MTTHKYPADIPAERQQAIDDELARIRHILTQPHVSAAAWQARALAAERDLHAERKAHEATKKGGALERALAGLDEAMRLREGFMAQIAFLEEERDRAKAALLAAVAEAEQANARADARGAI